MSRTRNYRDTVRSTILFEPLEGRRMFSAGVLDPSFSVDGKTTLAFNAGGTEFASDVAVQSDGKTVVVGHVEISVPGFSTIRRFAVARFNFDGTPDTTFGQFHTGKEMISVGSNDDAEAHAVAIQSDGKIVVCGEARVGSHIWDVNFAVVRLTSNGLPDPTFDGDGRRTIDYDGTGGAADVAIQNDGKIILVGSDYDSGFLGLTGDNDFGVVRLNTNGSLDSSFDGDGKRALGFGGDEYASAVALDSFGRIVVVGQRFTSSFETSTIAVARLNPNGSRDAGFGPSHDGQILTSIPGRPDSSANGVLVQSDGKIVVVGQTGDSDLAAADDMAVLRYLSNGQLDTTFGPAHTGVVEADFGGADRAFDAIQLANGSLVVAGTFGNSFALAGFTASGAVNNSFGAGGRVITDFGPNGKVDVVGIAKGTGGRFVVAGGHGFNTARYVSSTILLNHPIGLGPLPILTPLGVFADSRIDELV